MSGNRTRGVLAVLAAGLILTFLAAFGVDRIIEARRSGLHRSTESGSPESVALDPYADEEADAIAADVVTDDPTLDSPEQHVQGEPARAQS